MPFTVARGLAVHYELAGSATAPVVLLANSLGTNFHLWDAQAPALCERYRVLRYDMRGHGLTEAGDTATTIEALADDAAALLDSLEIESVHFVGLSIGGLVAQRFAAAFPQRTERLVLCATASLIGPPEVWDARIAAVEAGGMDAIVDGVLERWFTPRSHRERPALLRGYACMLARTPAAGYVAACRAIQHADLRPDDARIAAPALVVAGDGDPVTTPRMAADLQAAIRGAELVVLPGAAHMLCAEAPEALNAEVLRFLGAPVRPAVAPS